MRRLPVYLLLDVSGSMRGEPIKAVNEGIRILTEQLRCNPYALETAYISIICFNNTVEQVVPLTELYKFSAPELEARLGTYIGKAIKFLSIKAEEEVVKTTCEKKGDWKPLVFIMSDGRSGDKISKAMAEFNRDLFGNIFICVTGKEPNIDALTLISHNIVQIEELNSESIHAYFKWISASVSTTSTHIEEHNNDAVSMDDLPPLPTKINLVKL